MVDGRLTAAGIPIEFGEKEWREEIGRLGASEAPFGFVFQLAQDSDDRFVWNFTAFGERHPDNPATRTVYERAHKRIHGRYP
jgi:hypothetical protein